MRSAGLECLFGKILFVAAVLFVLPLSAFGQQVEVTTDKKTYHPREKVSVKITNNLATGIFTVAASSKPEMGFSNIEQKASVGWDALPLRCRQPSCRVDYTIPEPVEIKAGSAVTFLWQPKIFSENVYKDPDPGLYRVTILYLVKKDKDSGTMNGATVRSNNFTLE
jgi:hypothetical protein